MTELEMLRQYVSKFAPELPFERARNLMMSPHSTFDAVVEGDEVVGGIIYLSFEECGFSIICSVHDDELLQEVPMYEAIFAPFEFQGSEQVYSSWWRSGQADAATPLYLYYQFYKGVQDPLQDPTFTSMLKENLL